MSKDDPTSPVQRERDELIKYILTKAKASLHQDKRPTGYFDEILRKVSLIMGSSDSARSSK